ncbi:hydrolase/acyltransferase [Gracilaria domingensis]|nr:hydrolase/acyltransferase [Gracilaria domingensis]
MAFDSFAFALPLSVGSVSNAVGRLLPPRRGQEPRPVCFLTRLTVKGRTSHSGVNMETIVGLQTPTYAPCVPSEAAAKIEDAKAQHMLQRIQYTPIQTALPKQTIYTSHVSVSSSLPSTSAKLVFLHGFDSNMLEYRFLLPLIEQANVQAHFIDVLGWGLTECPTLSEFSYGPRAKREHLRAFIDQEVGGGPLILIGASLGGAIAIDFALSFPDLVQGMVLLSPQAFVDKPSSPVMSIGGLASMGAEVLRSRWLRRMAGEMSYENPDLRKSEEVLKIGGLHCQRPGWKEAAVDFIKGEGYCLSSRVREVTCPTLVMWGEQDRVLPKKNAKRFVEEMANCRLKYVENCGHCPHIEKPSLVTDNILEFARSERAQ